MRGQIRLAERGTIALDSDLGILPVKGHDRRTCLADKVHQLI